METHRSRNRQQLPLVVLMPVYEDRESASHLFKELALHCAVRPYVVVVEDGSLKNPVRASDIGSAGLGGEVLHLARNMGHQKAIATGIAYVNMRLDPHAVVVMDSDGEDRPDAIDPLVRELADGDVDAVVALRRRRSESLRFRAFYFAYRYIFKALTGHPIRFGNFTALSSNAVRRLAAMPESWVHFAAALLVSRLRIRAVPTDRGSRYYGVSRMNFSSLALHGLRSMMVFSDDVLVRVGLVSTFLAVVALALLGIPVAHKLMGIATPGWFTTASGILILIVLQAGGLTFATLMVSGAMRSAPPISHPQLDLLIDRIERAEQQSTDGSAVPVA